MLKRSKMLLKRNRKYVLNRNKKAYDRFGKS